MSIKININEESNSINRKVITTEQIICKFDNDNLKIQSDQFGLKKPNSLPMDINHIKGHSYSHSSGGKNNISKDNIQNIFNNASMGEKVENISRIDIDNGNINKDKIYAGKIAVNSSIISTGTPNCGSKKKKKGN